MTATLTPAGKALLTSIGRREFSFFDDGIVENSGIWEMCLADESVGVAASAKGVALVIRKLVRDGYLEINDCDNGDDGPWVSLTALGAKTALELANPATTTENKENTMSEITANLNNVLPGQDFIYNGQTLRMVKVNASGFRAELASGEVKSFKTRKMDQVVHLETTAPTAKADPKPFDGPVEIKWSGKVRETKTIVEIRDAGKGADPRWSLRCVDHDQTAVSASSAAAWADSAHPLQWCPTCKVL